MFNRLPSFDCSFILYKTKKNFNPFFLIFFYFFIPFFPFPLLRLYFHNSQFFIFTPFGGVFPFFTICLFIPLRDNISYILLLSYYSYYTIKGISLWLKLFDPFGLSDATTPAAETSSKSLNSLKVNNKKLSALTAANTSSILLWKKTTKIINE